MHICYEISVEKPKTEITSSIRSSRTKREHEGEDTHILTSDQAAVAVEVTMEAAKAVAGSLRRCRRGPAQRAAAPVKPIVRNPNHGLSSTSSVMGLAVSASPINILFQPKSKPTTETDHASSPADPAHATSLSPSSGGFGCLKFSSPVRKHG